MLEVLYGLSSIDPWTHYIRPPQEFWEAYCGAEVDWPINGLESEDKLCPYCLVLKEMEDAESASSI